MDEFFAFDWSFIDRIGDNPFQAMWFFISSGGWLVFLIAFLYMAVKGWQGWRQNLFGMKKQWVVLAVDVPRMHEQGPKAVDNMFAYLAGAHSANSWTEDWIVGRTQDTLSFEIASTEGHVQFVIRTTRALRDLVEAAIYSQYPDADVREVEDYTLKVPQQYPDEEWDLWGTQFVPAKASDVFMLRTYPEFEDKVSGEFKDPLSAMLESMSRLGPGEHAWFQIVLTPIAQKDYQKKAAKFVEKLSGREKPAKKSALEKVAEFPITAMGALASGLSSAPAAPPKKDAPAMPSRLLHMTKTELEVMNGIENKASKIVYLAKLRLVYVAKKTVMTKSRVSYTIIGAIKQFNSNAAFAIKPDFNKVGISGALWWFKAQRNNGRKNRLLSAYRNRSNWTGLENFHLCTEELATLWHFPHALQVKSPQLKKTQSKTAEPPINIPFA